MLNWLGYMLAIYGPWRLTCSADNLIGRWSLPRAGMWAYRNIPQGEAHD